LGKDVGPLTDELWKEMDDDGNGFANFSEFAEFTTKFQVELPLGLDELLVGNAGDAKRCGVSGCGCMEFKPKRRQCKYGADCYQKSQEHRDSFCHPCDPDWDLKGSQDVEMCRCGHKRALHSSAMVGAAMAAYPSYWIKPGSPEVEDDPSHEFNIRIKEENPVFLEKFQMLIDRTYSDVTTRDRVNHCKTWMVPRNFKLVEVHRNENSRLWRKYTIQKAELQRERRELQAEYPTFTTKTSEHLYDLFEQADKHLDKTVNEWYLFHGTSASAARNICGNDFKLRLAGSNTGTLYGRGTYLAESITKADEYSKEEQGVFTVLVCRVLGGRVRYCDERNPDAEALTQDCVSGDFDSILGDRLKVSKTYREFIIFDSQNIYPEYVLKYKRGEWFKSPSHP